MFFLGYRKTHKLHQALKASILFQQEQLTGETSLKSIRMHGADYIGLSLSPSLTHASLLKEKERLSTALYRYCPELSFPDPELLFETLSPSV